MQPLIAGRNPLHFDSDADGSFLGARHIYGARAPIETSNAVSTWFSRCCAHADVAARIGFAASVVYLMAAGFYGAMLNTSLGHPSDMAIAAFDAVSRKIGLTIDSVVIRGRVQATETDVMRALGVTPETSIASFDSAKAQERLLALGWIKTAEIQSLWPSTLLVVLSERTPIVVWRSDAQNVAMDMDGVVLGPVKSEELTGLLRVTGEGAPALTRSLIDALATHPQVRGALTEAECVSARRWDIRLASGLLVKLPENAAPAIVRLEALLVEQTLPFDQIESLDLRVDEQIAVAAKSDAKDLRRQLLSVATNGQSNPRFLDDSAR